MQLSFPTLFLRFWPQLVVQDQWVLDHMVQIIWEEYSKAACSKNAHGAVNIQIMLYEHILLGKFFKIIHDPYDPGLYGPEAYGLGTALPGPQVRGQNLKKTFLTTSYAFGRRDRTRSLKEFRPCN